MSLWLCLISLLFIGCPSTDLGDLDASRDTGRHDTGSDSSAGDVGDMDSSGTDSGGSDIGGNDAGGGDGAGGDTGTGDTGTGDTGTGDTGAGDVSIDAGGDAGAPFECVDATCVGKIVISEFRTRGPASATDEFVEIYNRSSGPVDVSELELRYRTAGGTESRRATVAAITIIPPGSYLLFAHTDYVGTVDVSDRWTSGFSDTGGTLFLRAGSDIVDMVGWGTAMVANSETKPLDPGGDLCEVSCERKALISSTAASMESGADVLSGNGFDSDNNADDFVQRTAADPQTASSTPEVLLP